MTMAWCGLEGVEEEEGEEEEEEGEEGEMCGCQENQFRQKLMDHRSR